MAYTTRSQTKVSLPASLFGWLAGAWIASWLTTFGLWLLGVSMAFDEPRMSSFQGWTVLLTAVALTAVSLAIAVIPMFYFRPTLVAERKLERFMFRDVSRSRWFLTTVAWFILLLTALTWAEAAFPEGIIARIAWLTLVPTATVVGYLSTRELRRIHGSSITTPLFTDGLVPVPSHEKESNPLWRSLGPDWAAPQCVKLLETAQKYRDVAKSRATTLHFTGKAIAGLFLTLTITALVKTFTSPGPKIAVAVPVALGSVVVLGWWLERRAADVDKLADMYAGQVDKLIDSSQFPIRPHRWGPRFPGNGLGRVRGRRSQVAGRL